MQWQSVGVQKLQNMISWEFLKCTDNLLKHEILSKCL